VSPPGATWQLSGSKSFKQKKVAAVRKNRGCGREFQVIRPWQRVCSNRCRVRAHRLRQAVATLSYYGA
jgi:predicted nucleic acid-binding Zn ribbon protein